MKTGWQAAVLGALALSALAGCGGVQVMAESTLPRPLVEELPLRAGIYYSAEFRNYTAREERWSTKWQVALGAGHVAAIDRLTKAMFASVTPLADLAKLPSPPLDLILEPRFEEYSFLTPRDSGAELYAVTIKYRINLYDGQGRLVDSLVLTGFGNELAATLSSSGPLAGATRKAMRDAGAKFAAEFPDQPVVRKLLRHEAVLPLAPGSTAAAVTGGIGEVQPVAMKGTPPPPPPPAATPAAAAAAPAVPAAAGATPQGSSPPVPQMPAPATPEPAAEPAPGPTPDTNPPPKPDPVSAPKPEAAAAPKPVPSAA